MGSCCHGKEEPRSGQPTNGVFVTTWVTSGCRCSLLCPPFPECRVMSPSPWAVCSGINCGPSHVKALRGKQPREHLFWNVGSTTASHPCPNTRTRIPQGLSFPQRASLEAPSSPCLLRGLAPCFHLANDSRQGLLTPVQVDGPAR